MTEILLDHVTKDFEIDRRAVRAIDDISLTFPSGSVVVSMILAFVIFWITTTLEKRLTSWRN